MNSRESLIGDASASPPLEPESFASSLDNKSQSQRPPKVPAYGPVKRTPSDEGPAAREMMAPPVPKPVQRPRRLGGYSQGSSMPEAREILFAELQQNHGEVGARPGPSVSLDDKPDTQDSKISLRSLLKGQAAGKPGAGETPGSFGGTPAESRRTSGIGGMGIFQVANLKMKAKKRVAAARKVLDSLPAWLTTEVLNNTTRKVGGRSVGHSHTTPGEQTATRPSHAIKGHGRTPQTMKRWIPKDTTPLQSPTF
jgi:hypothetical protein